MAASDTPDDTMQTLFDPAMALGHSPAGKEWALRRYRHYRQTQLPMVAAYSVWNEANNIQTITHRDVARKEWKIYHARRNLRMVWKNSITDRLEKYWRAGQCSQR